MKKYPSTIEVKDSKEAKNPAIMLFGNRFFSDQTVMELLTELFLVCCSSKKISQYSSIAPLMKLSNYLLLYPFTSVNVYLPHASMTLI